MKTYRVSRDLYPYVRRSLLNHYYSCRILQDADYTLKCATNASSDTFHKIVQEARAQKKSMKIGSTWINKAEFNTALLTRGVRHFKTDVILDKYL